MTKKASVSEVGMSKKKSSKNNNKVLISANPGLSIDCSDDIFSEVSIPKKVSPDCIFCKIIAGAIPATIIADTSDVIVIKDIFPKAPIHYLIIPKKHIASIKALDASDAHLMGSVMLMAKELFLQSDDVADFRLISNNGPGAGQSVFHIHFHFLAGKKMYDF